MTTYREYHAKSLRDPAGFWSEQARLIDWQQPFSQVLDYSKPPFAKWFIGGTTNLCISGCCHCNNGDQPALIYVSHETGDEKKTYPTAVYREGHPWRENGCSSAFERGDRV